MVMFLPLSVAGSFFALVLGRWYRMDVLPNLHPQSDSMSSGVEELRIDKPGMADISNLALDGDVVLRVTSPAPENS
ncbi:hypothetical protein BABINDRAFT_161093 [Babjeviella inositovora NRRL Y-12698]|uniref:Uncharacterized protein n=1 Tax=Babjeviella inositovora NRRL Y-12698 TaxID=984486 RepID=A0A1E3QQY2_9ASCO|nr:uncharacterized protein BABINDRAFT_161093 [Babjeviella inositovora NRRL Y-12698]ODQ80103.1 hypothetical protein BABINDRAFT_161093 [Babjeviella inositovora NRRL Y-12698]